MMVFFLLTAPPQPMHPLEQSFPPCSLCVWSSNIHQGERCRNAIQNIAPQRPCLCVMILTFLNDVAVFTPPCKPSPSLLWSTSIRKSISVSSTSYLYPVETAAVLAASAMPANPKVYSSPSSEVEQHQGLTPRGLVDIPLPWSLVLWLGYPLLVTYLLLSLLPGTNKREI